MKTATKNRAIIYTRVSTEEQRELGASLRYQEEQLRKYCERKDITVVAHYQDDETGTTINRDKFTVMLDWVSRNKNKVDLILVTRSDRFMRNLLEMMKMKERLKTLGVKFVAIEQERDDSSPESMLIETLQYSMDELESKKIGLRVRAANYRFAKEGAFLNKAPRGYDKTRINEKSSLKPNDYAKVIQDIFNAFAGGGYSTEALRKKLELNNFSKQGFINVLKNRVYAGYVQVPAFQNDETYWVKGLHEPIIDIALFERVQAVLKGKRPSPIKVLKTESPFFLRGHVICPCCQRPFTASSSKGRKGYYAYYHCDSKYNCNQRFTKNSFENTLIELLCGFKVKKSVEQVYHDILKNVIGDTAKYKAKRINELEQQLAGLSHKTDKNQDMLLNDKINDVTFNSINNRLTLEKQTLESELLQVKAQPDGELFTMFDKGVSFVNSLKRILLLANAEDRSLIIGSIFPKKLIFYKGEYRTTEINSFILLLCPSIKGFGLLEKEKATKIGGLSTNAPKDRLFSNQVRADLLRIMAIYPLTHKYQGEMLNKLEKQE